MVFLVTLAILCCASMAESYRPSQRLSIGLWPTPKSVRNGTATVAVDSSTFVFTTSAETDVTPTLKAAITRYTSLIFLHGRGPAPAPSPQSPLIACQIAVGSSTEVLDWGMDESYTVSVAAKGGSSGCNISAVTYVGALYGMETLSQLILSDGGSLQHHTAGELSPLASGKCSC